MSESALTVIEVTPADQTRNKVIVTVDGNDYTRDYTALGISFESSDSEIMSAIAPIIQEEYGVDIRNLYKIRKAVNSQNIHIIPNSTAGATRTPRQRRTPVQAAAVAPMGAVVSTNGSEALSELTNEERLVVYNHIISGCQHLYSKGKLQKDKAVPFLQTLVKLGQEDPYFLAHLNAYAIKSSEAKDLKIFTTFANFLSDADGTPFSAQSKYKKPNLRMSAQAALQELDPKSVKRVIELAQMKIAYGTRYREAQHFPRSLSTALSRYLRYREQFPQALEGIRKAGLSKITQYLYRAAQISPSEEAYKKLNWRWGSVAKGTLKQLLGREKNIFNFKGMSSIEIAEKIRKNKLPVLGAMGALQSKLDPVIACALLEQATGDQAVILRGMFDSQGLLKHSEVKDVFQKKVATAKTALDRVDRLNKEIDPEVTQILKSARADKRKEQMGNVGRVFMHVDISGSMHAALELAKDYGAIIAECIQDPSNNFGWGLFNGKGYALPLPDKFEKDAFQAVLYGKTAGGSTNCFALSDYARDKGFDIDVYITDEQHTDGSSSSFVQRLKREGKLPKGVVIINVDHDKRMGMSTNLGDAYAAEGVSVVRIPPSALKESALVAQAIKTSMKGAVAVIEDIMATPLLTLPQWWESVSK